MDPDIDSRWDREGENRRQIGEDDTAGVHLEGGDNDPQKRRVATPSPGFKERRRSQRFQCSGAVEIQADGSDVRLTGNLTDISLHGCYTEMPTTFPVGTQVTLKIDAHGVRFRTRAKVGVTYPFLGMGMCFSETEPGQELQLAELLGLVVGERTVIIAQAGHPDASDLVGSTDARACLEDIATFFRDNTILSRDEFFAIAKRVRRS